jgi:hypothetical protein
MTKKEARPILARAAMNENGPAIGDGSNRKRQSMWQRF